MTNLKAAASRENGAKSLGPKTPEGRERSSQNALKLGIFSQRRLLEGESEAEFKALFDALIIDLEPVGVLELYYVDKITSIIWRKRRLECAEVGAIRRERNGFLYGMREQQWSELAPTLAHRLGNFSDESVKRLEALRDDIAISVRSIPTDDEKFARVETSLDRALERAVKGLRDAQASRRASIEAIILNPTRSAGEDGARVGRRHEAEVAEVDDGESD